jgi:HNH endonuclease
MVHDADGAVIAVGDRTRKPSSRLRRAVRERDRYRCRFPGCESRRTDVHHIVYWANGGATRLENLICLCKRHHHLVHDKQLIIAAATGGFTFHAHDGTPLPASPPPPASVGGITACHPAAITPATIIPPNSGERLDLHMAIWVAFTNARVKAERRQRERDHLAQAQAA